MMNMQEKGTPWAEEYRGSGRLTGHVAEEPTYTSTGDVAPGWRWVGDMDEIDFWDTAESEQISQSAAALGSITSDAKAAAARLNGRKGGRPRKS